MSNKKAFLVTASVTTRVVADAQSSDEDIFDLAHSRLIANLADAECLESVVEDTEYPAVNNQLYTCQVIANAHAQKLLGYAPTFTLSLVTPKPISAELQNVLFHALFMRDHGGALAPYLYDESTLKPHIIKAYDDQELIRIDLMHFYDHGETEQDINFDPTDAIDEICITTMPDYQKPKYEICLTFESPYTAIGCPDEARCGYVHLGNKVEDILDVAGTHYQEVSPFYSNTLFPMFTDLLAYPSMENMFEYMKKMLFNNPDFEVPDDSDFMMYIDPKKDIKAHYFFA